MARTNHRSNQTKKHNTKRNLKSNSLNMKKYSNRLIGLFGGAVFGGVAAVAVMLFMVAPMIRSDVASSLNDQAVAFKDASNTITPATGTSCALPTSSSASVTSLSSAKPTTLPPNVFVPTALTTPVVGAPAVVQKSSLVTGVFDTGSSTISDTGEKSANTISTTNVDKTTVTNTNDVTLTNNNAQTAKSGAATTSNNVNAGSSTTGTAANTSSSNYDVYINN